jgi:hypothetical protein
MTGTGSFNTSGTAANLSGTPALPNGATATTGTVGEADTKIATNQQVANAVSIPLVGTNYSTSTIAASTTNYAQPVGVMSWGAFVAGKTMAFPRSGTISHFTVCTSGTQSATGSMVFTYYLGSAWGGAIGTFTAQTPTVTIAASQVQECATDSTHSFPYTAGLPVMIQVVNNATATSATIVETYAEFTGAN